MGKKEIEIKPKFLYKATDSVIKSAANQTQPKPASESQLEYQKKSIETLAKKVEPIVLVIPGETENDNLTGFSIPIKHKNSLIFGYIPEAVTAFLHLSFEHLKNYLQIKEHIENNYQAGRVIFTFPDKNTYYQKFFTHSYAIIIFLSTAMEAAINEALPDEVAHKGDLLPKEVAERKLTLLEKYKIGPLREGKISESDFQQIVKLQKTRDTIIHFKSLGKDWTLAQNLDLFQDLSKLDLKALFDTICTIISKFHKDEIKFIQY